VNRNDIVGGTEHLVLAAVPRLQKKGVSTASGTAVQKEVKEQAKRELSIGAICTTLERLEKRGLLESEISDRDGRRPKRFYSLTEPGLQALVEARSAFDGLWKGLGRMLPKLSPIPGR